MTDIEEGGGQQHRARLTILALLRRGARRSGLVRLLIVEGLDDAGLSLRPERAHDNAEGCHGISEKELLCPRYKK